MNLSNARKEVPGYIFINSGIPNKHGRTGNPDGLCRGSRSGTSLPQRTVRGKGVVISAEDLRPVFTLLFKNGKYEVQLFKNNSLKPSAALNIERRCRGCLAQG